MVILRIIAAVAVGYAVLVFFVQRAVAFPGQFRPPLVEGPPDGVESVPLATSFGTVEAWYYAPDTASTRGRAEAGGGPSEASTRPAAVFFHGNGELIDDWPDELQRLAAAGLGVLAVEFPGYGRSEGKPRRSTVREASASAFDWLASRPDVDAARIVSYGRSMGGGAAADLAVDRPVAALVLQSTFSSTTAMAHMALTPGFLVRDRFAPGRIVAEWDGPVLLMHGRSDDVIPYRQAEDIAAARPGLSVTDIPCGHNDCAPAWPVIVEHVVAFLGENDLLP
jgi:pimeloyl-ACP methyl ester carboxylesterase